MNIAIYARVSTSQQAEHGYSLQTQVEACKKKAVELGATSIKEYIDDGYSGAYLERPALDNLRDALSAKLHDYVIIYDIDRLSRDTMHLLLLTEEIEKNATLVYVNSEYNKTPEGQLFFEIRGSFAKYERVKIQDRFQRGKRGKLRKGLPISDHQVYGYDWQEDEPHKGNYVINEHEAEIVRQIFDRYINSLGGYREIIDWLEERGIPSPKGLPRWSDYGFQKLLHRQMYTGEYYAYTVYNKKVSAKKFTHTPRDKSEWIPMTCPAIISKETFEKAQAKIKRNTQQHIRESKHTAMLSGILYCGSCGRKMRSCKDTRHPNYKYYQCNAIVHHDPSCQNHSVKCEIADDKAWKEIVKICKNEKMLSKYTAEYQPQKKDNTESIRKELQSIETKRQAIMNWFSANLITTEESTIKLQALKKQEKALKEKLSTKTEKINTAEIVSAVRKDFTFEEKRQFVLQYISKVIFLRKNIDKDNIELIFHFVFR